jgi:hypothetical protein
MHGTTVQIEGRVLEVAAWTVVTDQWCAPLDEDIFSVSLRNGNFLTSCASVSFSRRTLVHGVPWSSVMSYRATVQRRQNKC